MISFLQCIIFEPISYSEFILTQILRNMVFSKFQNPHKAETLCNCPSSVNFVFFTFWNGHKKQKFPKWSMKDKPVKKA